MNFPIPLKKPRRRQKSLPKKFRFFFLYLENKAYFKGSTIDNGDIMEKYNNGLHLKNN